MRVALILLAGVLGMQVIIRNENDPANFPSAYTVGVFSSSTVTAAGATPVQVAETYPAARIPCNQTRLEEVESPATITDPTEGRIEDPRDVTKDCVIDVSWQITALPAGTYRTAVQPIRNDGVAGAWSGVSTTFTVSAKTLNTAAYANTYDDAWQTGSAGWVAKAKQILNTTPGQIPGLVLWIGDSLTRDQAMGAWAQSGAGKTTTDTAITSWMHAGQSAQSVSSIDGFALASPYICSQRSYTVGDGLGSWDFMGSCSMPADTNPTTAAAKLNDCASWSNCLNLTTMLYGLQRAQFAIPEVNLDAGNPGTIHSTLIAMLDLLESRGVVPIIITYTYRTDAAFNLLVDQYNTALVNLAQTRKYPLIDFQQEMKNRIPFSSLTAWDGRFLADGVHYTNGGGGYTSTTSPYIDGGNSATHLTGAPLTYNGYGLKGWLGVQKMKEIKALVIDVVP